MISNPNPFGITFPPGTLKIAPLKATVNEGVILMSFCTPFCKVRFGGGLQETAPDKQNGRSPVWHQELTFKRKDENSFKVELCNPNIMFGPTIIGECFINLDLVFAQRHAKIRSELTMKGKSTGSIEVSIIWEPDNYMPTYESVQTVPLRSNPFQSGPLQPVMGYPVQSNPSFGHSNSQTFNNNGVYQEAPTYMQFPTQNISFVNYSAPQQQVNMQPFVIQRSFSQHIPSNPQVSNMNPGPEALLGLNQGQQIIAQEEPEEPIDPDLPDEQKCVVCLERKKAGAFYRCGHNSCCWTCGKRFIGKPCPICRQVVLDFIKVYDS